MSLGNKVLIHVTVWMNIENVMLSEHYEIMKALCQSQKLPIVRFRLYKAPRIVKSRDRKQIGDCLGLAMTGGEQGDSQEVQGFFLR